MISWEILSWYFRRNELLLQFTSNMVVSKVSYCTFVLILISIEGFIFILILNIDNSFILILIEIVKLECSKAATPFTSYVATWRSPCSRLISLLSDYDHRHCVYWGFLASILFLNVFLSYCSWVLPQLPRNLDSYLQREHLQVWIIIGLDVFQIKINQTYFIVSLYKDVLCVAFRGCTSSLLSPQHRGGRGCCFRSTFFLDI